MPDRSRVTARADAARVFTKGGLLVDGFLAEPARAEERERKRPRLKSRRCFRAIWSRAERRSRGRGARAPAGVSRGTLTATKYVQALGDER